MKVFVYQQQGTAQGKVEMEDRVLAGKNILADGFHVIEAADSGIYAVFDGVGGLKGSAFASSLAAKSMSDLAMPCGKDEASTALREIHEELVNYSSTATTASGLVWNDEENVFLFHIGNSRVSMLQDGYLVPLTEDMTNYERMKQTGISEGSISDDLKSVLTACLGARRELIDSLEVQDVSSDIERCARILITSDGVHDHLSIDDLEAFLKEPPSYDALEEIANRAVACGSEDDISILVIEK